MIELTESQVKVAVEQYLQVLKNQGRLWYERLNSGSLLAQKGERVYRVELCEEGTADFIVVYWTGKAVEVCFVEIKGSKGKQSQEQKAFQKIVEAQGCKYVVVNDAEQAMWLVPATWRGGEMLREYERMVVKE